MAMQKRPGTERLHREVVQRWIEMAEAVGADGTSIRLDIAVMRGLLLDALLSGDRRGVDEAFERYVAMRPDR